ncbi:Nucleoporin NSP1 [Yarrowia sp. C11]|nr:Nucleoporin NSP1 [Yarrowia sp. E02]KAG5369637.1 Nucleoporin NSP1 [Yarrowia sp. C11]
MKQDRTKRRLYTGPYDNSGRAGRANSAQRDQGDLRDRGTNDGHGTLKSLVSSLWSKFRGSTTGDIRQRRHSVAMEEGDTTVEFERQQQENWYRFDNNNDTNEFGGIEIQDDEVDEVGAEIAAFQWVNGDAASIINAYKAAMLEKQEAGQRPERKRQAIGSPERDIDVDEHDIMAGALVLHEGDHNNDYNNSNDVVSKMIVKSTASKRQPNRYKVAAEARRAPARVPKRPKYVDSETQTSSVPISRRLPWSIDLQSLPQERMSRPGFYSANFELSDEESEDDVEIQGNVTAEEIDNLNKPLPFDLKATFLKHRTPSKRAQKSDDNSSPVYTLNRAATKANNRPSMDVVGTEAPEEQPTKTLPAQTSAAPATIIAPVAKPSAGFDFGASKEKKESDENAGGDSKPKQITFSGSKGDEKPKPSFSFGGGFKDDASKPGGPKNEDKPKPLFSFDGAKGDSTKEKKPSESKPSFSFGSTKPEEKPSSTLETDNTKQTNGTDAKPMVLNLYNDDNKSAQGVAPSFAFGKKTDDTKPEESKVTPAFNFGTKPTPENPPTAPAFMFGAKTDSAPKPLTFGSKPEDNGLAKESSTGDKPPPKPMFSFGSTPSAAPDSTQTATDKPKPSSFTFGTKVPEASPATEKPAAPLFSFGAKTDSKDAPVDSSTTSKPLFGGFGAAPTSSGLGGKRSADDSEQPSKKPLFSGSSGNLGAPFGSGASNESTSGSSAPKPFTFGSSATTPSSTGTSGTSTPALFGSNTAATTNGASNNKPSFTFGGEAPASSKPAFSFGGAGASETKDEPKPGSFGSVTKSTAAPSTFSFGSASSTSTTEANKPAATGFSFGVTPSTPPAASSTTSSTGFSFNKPAGEKPMFGASASAAPSSGGFGGAPSTGTPATSSSGVFGGAPSSTARTGGLFGNSSSSTPSTGMFGAKPSTEAAPSTGEFKFGSTTNAFGSANTGSSGSANTATPASTFGFGGAAPTQSASTGFGFGGSPSNVASPSFGAAAPTNNSTSGFSFGGAAPAAGAGSFSFGGAGSAANTFGFNGAGPSTPGTPANSFGANTAPAPQTPTFGSPAPVQNNMFAQGFPPAGDSSGRKIAPLRARNRRR